MRPCERTHLLVDVKLALKPVNNIYYKNPCYLLPVCWRGFSTQYSDYFQFCLIHDPKSSSQKLLEKTQKIR